jgi:hypothetical protein
LHLTAAETVADVLETYGRLAFDTAFSRASEVIEHCMRWAASTTRNAPGRKVVLQGTSSPPARTDWGGLIAFFRETRRHEGQAVLHARHDLTATVQGFARIFHGMLLRERALDATCAKALVRLTGALAAPGEDPLLEAANELVNSVGALLRERSRAGEERLQVLRNHVQQLERGNATACFHSPFEVDVATGLHNAAAFAEHLGFVAVTGALFDRPPLLIALRLALPDPDAADDAERPLAVTDALYRAFPSRHCFISRPNPDLFTLVCAAIDLGDAHSAVRGLLMAAANQPSLSRSQLRVGIASNVPGEASHAWYMRALDALSRARSFECVIAAAPASFEERA